MIDIGCGEGDFLDILKKQKNCHTFGIEIESERVASALSKGLSIIQGDALTELPSFPSKDVVHDSFDYAILANSLQVMKNPKVILENARRISNRVMISIPNFGFIANRFYLLFKGKMPVTKQLSYEWYETPNIHFSTITDFIDLVKKVGFEIEKSYFIDHGGDIKDFPAKNPTIANLFGRNGVFILK